MSSNDLVQSAVQCEMTNSLSATLRHIGICVNYCNPILQQIGESNKLVTTQKFEINTIENIVASINLFTDISRNFLFLKNELEMIIEDYSLERLLSEIALI